MDAQAWFIAKFPERWAYLEQERHKIRIWKLYDWLALEENLKKQVAEQEN